MSHFCEGQCYILLNVKPRSFTTEDKQRMFRVKRDSYFIVKFSQDGQKSSTDKQNLYVNT